VRRFPTRSAYHGVSPFVLRRGTGTGRRARRLCCRALLAIRSVSTRWTSFRFPKNVPKSLDSGSRVLISLSLNLVPEYGRIVAALSPATVKKVLECIHAWRLAARTRSFGKLPGTQKAANRFSPDMQRAADSLLAHSVARECDHFVVSSQSFLPTPLLQFLRPGHDCSGYFGL